MAKETVNVLQVGPPRLLRMWHSIVNASMYIVAGDQPLPNHFWMVQRIGVTMQANPAVAGTPPIFALFHAPSGVVETATGSLMGVTLNGNYSTDLVLMDSNTFLISGATTLLPLMVADEAHPIMVPENRVIVAFINGYALAGALGNVQVDVQYTDWIIDVPKTSPLPQIEDAGAESS